MLTGVNGVKGVCHSTIAFFFYNIIYCVQHLVDKKTLYRK